MQHDFSIISWLKRQEQTKSLTKQLGPWYSHLTIDKNTPIPEELSVRYFLFYFYIFFSVGKKKNLSPKKDEERSQT